MPLPGKCSCACPMERIHHIPGLHCFAHVAAKIVKASAVKRNFLPLNYRCRHQECRPRFEPFTPPGPHGLFHVLSESAAYSTAGVTCLITRYRADHRHCHRQLCGHLVGEQGSLPVRPRVYFGLLLALPECLRPAGKLAATLGPLKDIDIFPDH